MIHSFEGSAWLIALPSAAAWAGNSEAVARSAGFNTASLEWYPMRAVWWTVQLWLHRGRKLWKRVLLSDRSLVWNDRSSFFGKQNLWNLWRKTTSLRFDSHGVTRWCICLPGTLLWQRAEEQQADPQLSSCVYAPIISSWLKGSVRACHRRTALPSLAPDLNVMRYESVICWPWRYWVSLIPEKSEAGVVLPVSSNQDVPSNI